MTTSESKLTKWYALGKYTPRYEGIYELRTKKEKQIIRAVFKGGNWHDSDTGEILDTSHYVGWRGVDSKLSYSKATTYLEDLQANYTPRYVRELFRHYYAGAWLWDRELGDECIWDSQDSIRAALLYGIGKILRVEFSPAEHEAAMTLGYGDDPFRHKNVKDVYMRFRGLPVAG